MEKLNKNIVIKRIGIESRGEVLELIKNYYTSETVDYKMLKYDLEEQRISDYKRANALLAYGLSVGVFDKNTNRLVAITLNAIVESGKPDEYNPTDAEDSKIRVLIRFIDYAERDVLDILNAKKVLYMNITTVMPGYRRLGLSAKMALASLEVAKENECEYVVATATTTYFSKSIGFKPVKRINYSEYVDEETGLRPFKDSIIEPHLHAAVFASQLM